MPTILIVGASRGLGASLVTKYASDSSNIVYATTRSTPKSGSQAANNVKWIKDIDLMSEKVSHNLAKALVKANATVDTVIITAGYFGLESFDNPSWSDQVTMYTTSAIAPVFIVQSLVKAEILNAHAKVILVSSEAGSIALRHESEGDGNGTGNYGHHASKAALNMVGKLLSVDLKLKDDVKDKKIAVGLVHPGFMRTEMTKGVGFDKFWDDGGAVTPDTAAESLKDWIEKDFNFSKTGEYWAPRGPADIGTAEPVLGKEISEHGSKPLQLPW